MSLITKPYTFFAGTTAVAAQVNADFDALFNDYNGNITDANIAPGANINSSKLAPITAPGRVNISSLTVANQAAGDMIVADTSTSWVRLPKGTALQHLRMKSDGTLPEWAANSASDALTGSVVGFSSSKSAEVVTCTTLIPNDDSIPQITEGDEVLTCSITPTSATSNLVISIQMTGCNSTSSYPAVALFKDAVVDALAAQWTYVNTVTTQLNLNHVVAAGTTDPITFRVRVGASAGTFTTNWRDNRIFGGVSYASITIMEVKA